MKIYVKIAFNNATFLARLETQMGTSTDFDKPPHADKIQLVTEGFALHSLLHYFGQKYLQSKGKISLVAQDNLTEIVLKAKQFL